MRAWIVLISLSLPACGAASDSSGGPISAATSGTGATDRRLVDTFYAQDLRTNIGGCATGRVPWTLVTAPAAARLERPGRGQVAGGGRYVSARGRRGRSGWSPRAAMGYGRSSCPDTIPCTWSMALTGAIRIRVLGPRWRPGARPDRAGAGSSGSACATGRSGSLNRGSRRRPWW